MGIITKVLKQTATYWAPLGADEDGQSTYAQPITLNCRWDDIIEQFFLKEEGAEDEVKLSKAMVMLSADVKVKGLLFLGTLTNTDDPDDPRSIEGVFEIQKFSSIPNFKATEFVRTAIL